MTPAARASLDRESVVRAGLALFDEVGLEKLTLRALAARLGVQAPAIYWYVDSKAAYSTRWQPRCCATCSRRERPRQATGG